MVSLSNHDLNQLLMSPFDRLRVTTQRLLQETHKNFLYFSCLDGLYPMALLLHFYNKFYTIYIIGFNYRREEVSQEGKNLVLKRGIGVFVNNSQDLTKLGGKDA